MAGVSQTMNSVRQDPAARPFGARRVSQQVSCRVPGCKAHLEAGYSTVSGRSGGAGAAALGWAAVVQLPPTAPPPAAPPPSFAAFALLTPHAQLSAFCRSTRFASGITMHHLWTLALA